MLRPGGTDLSTVPRAAAEPARTSRLTLRSYRDSLGVRRGCAHLVALLLGSAGLLAASPASAQVCGIKLGPGDAGIAVGCVARVDGLRFNFRDRYLQRVRGVNVTIWRPYDESEGVVTGLAIGLPVTGAAKIGGLALAAGIEVDQDFLGLALAPIGFRAGGRVRGYRPEWSRYTRQR